MHPLNVSTWFPSLFGCSAHSLVLPGGEFGVSSSNGRMLMVSVVN